jgi:hypothetical protein
MKKSNLVSAIALFAAIIVVQIQAVPVSYTGTQTQTTDGQNFNFNFAGVAASDGTGGTFVMHAQGDYDGGTSEALTWNIDSLVFGGPVGGFVGGVGVGGPFDFFTVFQPLGNIEFQRTYTLTGAQLNAILVDSFFDVFVDLDASVGLFDRPNYVHVTLHYNSSSVPDGGWSLALLGLAMTGIAAMRRKLRVE